VIRVAVASFWLIAGCGSLAVKEDGAVPSRDAAGDRPAQDAGRVDEPGLDGATDAVPDSECRSSDDCIGWPEREPVFCDYGTCCAGRLDRFGCVCGELRGGCPRGQFCCDDNLHPEIIVGCRDEPCAPR
jgi:hypothetical protein